MGGVYGGITIDVEWWTSDSESDPRVRPIRFLQPHHTATTSRDGARSLMDPGGRVVSANGLLDTDGTLYGVVPVDRRAFTSATTFDHDSFTVECVNSSGDPYWGLTDAQHRRLGQIAREIAALNGRAPGPDMIVQHKDVPGTYATSCAGPSYNGALVLDYALGGAEQEEDGMSYSITSTPDGTVEMMSLVSGNRINVGSYKNAEIAQRVKNSRINPVGWAMSDKILKVELDIVAGMIRAINPPVNMDAAAWDSLVAKIDAADDDETLSILNAVKAIKPGTGALTAEEVQKILDDDFDRIPDEVLNELRDRTAA